MCRLRVRFISSSATKREISSKRWTRRNEPSDEEGGGDRARGTETERRFGHCEGRIKKDRRRIKERHEIKERRKKDEKEMKEEKKRRRKEKEKRGKNK